MSDKTLIDNELFIISVFLLGTPLVLAALIGKDYSNITNFLKYTVPFVVLEVVGIIVTICILICLILKIFHLAQYWFVRRRINCLKQKEQSITQTRQDNLSSLRREMQKLFLEAKPLLNAENTIENKQKLEKIREKLLQSKFKDVALQDERIKYIRLMGEKIQQIQNYLQSKEKEILDNKEQIKNKLKVEKGYFKKAFLNEDEIQVLLEEGFVEEKCVGLDDKSTYSYLLKPRSKESVQHFFLTMIVADYIKSLGITVETPNSVEPDIIFEINKVKWAIEVETGTYPESKPEEFENKLQNLNQKYSEKWIFLVIHRKLTNQYRRYNTKTYNRHQIKKKVQEIIGTSKENIEKNKNNFDVLFINNEHREFSEISQQSSQQLKNNIEQNPTN